ncbi:MAG: hypothetical protein JO197_22030 [Acidobacteria bacterium]|nr:hypothetical protein [Acidobacteriota bacterium]MBV9474815.1 hypothetical protein [Acidobacteriota bacterium]
MRVLPFVLAVAAAVPSFAQSSSLHFDGYAAAQTVNATGPESWRTGDFGRLDAGAARDRVFGVAQLGGDWAPAKWFDVHASGAARRDPDDYRGDDAGLVEAYADLRATFTNDELQLRAGQFFLPTSRENIDPLWTSPYTIHFSALNSWIGEEVRPRGLDLQWRHTLQNGASLTAAATAFRDNDTMGALLAWRGWSVGSRLSTWNDVLPLPPVNVLTTSFPAQRDDGTVPLERDLDGRTGYSARVRYSVPQRALVQFTMLDNKGDRELYRGEYAWRTKFQLAGVQLGDPDAYSFAAEYMTGSTGMGTAPRFVQADFRAAYALLSEKRGRSRWTVRYDLFRVTDEDHSAAGSNEDSGRSWTLAYFLDLSKALRAGGEYTQVVAKRPAAQESGFDESQNGREVTLELRYRF